MAGRKVHVIAHGATPLDKQGRLHGQKVDASLSDEGRQAAHAAGLKLKRAGIETIYTSPLKRAKETAAILAEHTGARIEDRDELLPWDIGNLSGAKASSIGPMLEWFSARPDKPVPGGEQKNAVLSRYRAFVNWLRKGKGTVAISGHSQHTLGLDYAMRGGDAKKVKMIGGTPGEVKTISL
jgi:broad specificity phosphatase PhoE